MLSTSYKIFDVLIPGLRQSWRIPQVPEEVVLEVIGHVSQSTVIRITQPLDIIL